MADLVHCHTKSMGNFSYLLVLADTFSKQKEAFPAGTETTVQVAKALLKEIIPRFGLPGSSQSDNDSVFVSQVTKGITSALGIKCSQSGDPNPIIRESREIQSDLEMGFSEALLGNSRKLD